MLSVWWWDLDIFHCKFNWRIFSQNDSWISCPKLHTFERHKYNYYEPLQQHLYSSSFFLIVKRSGFYYFCLKSKFGFEFFTEGSWAATFRWETNLLKILQLPRYRNLIFFFTVQLYFWTYTSNFTVNSF